MEKYILKKEDLDEFLLSIIPKYRLFVPIQNEKNQIEYIAIKDASILKQMNLDRKPDISPKKILLPQREVLFEYKKSSNTVELHSPKYNEEQIAIFGMRPCDIEAVSLMDEVFCGGRYKDIYYSKRRENTVLIGLACTEPDLTCFCESVGGNPFISKKADIMFYDIGKSYFVESLTKKGNEFLRNGATKFTEPLKSDETAKNQIELKTKEQTIFKRKIDPVAVEKMGDLFNSGHWQKVARRCLGCGTCTYFCPTCYCFDINDEYGGKRVRTWDSCQFADFTMHTSGHNPRSNKTKRLRNRFYHKFKYSKDQYGRYFCVGCGRCIAFCPAGIDITKTINEVN